MDVKQTAVCSYDEEEGIFSITPFYNGDMIATFRVKLYDGFSIRNTSNLKYEWMIVDIYFHEVLLTKENLLHVLDEFMRLTVR